MKTLFSLLILFLFLSENAQSQVLLLEYPNETSQIAQKSAISLDLSLLAQHSNLQLELWHKDEMLDFVVLPEANLEYSWVLEKQKASTQYMIKVVSAKDGRLLAQTERFEIGKAKLVLGSKIAAIGAAPLIALSGLYVYFRNGILAPPDSVPVR